MKNRNTDIAILVLTVAACAIPFLWQPFHMDDGLYLDLARNVRNNPVFPHDFPYMFEGSFWRDMGSHSHPPFQAYFLSVIQHLFGEGPGTEWIYHAIALFFPVLAVVSFYWICARFVQRPLWPAMMLACSPLLLVMQHTLMTDVPMLSFWLAAVCLFLWAVHLRSTALYGLSTVFQIAAVFTSFQSVALAPLLGFYQLRKGHGKTGWVSLGIAPASIIAWYAAACVHYHRPLWTRTLEYMQVRSPLALDVLQTKLLAILEYHGWLVIFPLFILYLLARDLKWRMLVIAILASAYVAQFKVPQYHWTDKAIFVIGLSAGFFVVLEMGKVAWRAFSRASETYSDRADEQFLGLWYFGYFTYCLFFVMEGSARYILPMLPPFILCFFRVLEKQEILEYRLPKRLMNSALLASGSLVLSLVWGMALSRADLQFAEIYPQVASDISRIAGRIKSYSVGEWGFRYYLARANAGPLPADISQIRGGSFFVVPTLAKPNNNIPADLESMAIPVFSKMYTGRTMLRTLDWQSPAGFYSTGWGLIPFSFSRNALEEVRVFQISFMTEQLPWARIESASGIIPWPGRAELNQDNLMAILAKPGTRLVYPWSPNGAAVLELRCGISPDSYHDGAMESFRFEVRQRDTEGNVLAEKCVVLHPGTRKEDRLWQKMRIPLKEASGGLEFFYEANRNAEHGTGAFAQAVIKPAS